MQTQMQIILPNIELHKIENEFVNIPHAHHHEYQITVPIKGSCEFHYESRYMELRAGEGLVVNPADRHCFQMGNDSGIIIVIAKDELVGQAYREERPIQRPFAPAAMLSYFQRCASRFIAMDHMDSLAVEESQSLALAELGAMLAAGRQSKAEPAKLEERASDWSMMQVLEYIRSHYTEQLDIDQLAAVALQSRYHFIRSFKLAMGVTPYQYVLRLRVEEAKRQLRKSEHTVTDISFNVGFSSPSQFYRVFMKFSGMTPESFRGM
ncbi:AraC family transcriptional regulator [Paenibacillus sp. 1011MAR3C5]|uniref:AraC family transcriptional regulator n=1 Tax=Paenibacillus sp. 1011MAR3C5 TaxID=1675787 RepID=UPI000E6C2B75|nr:AraC family transcriptional regulator [Paenibacillus sp. 1011MAR3C5]RJE86972.1 AraC family transcriptional regulator [Paenibacillus sp. 1011MAR3C5]